MFVQSLSRKSHEIVVCIGFDETFIPCKSGTTTLLKLTYIVDPIISRHGLESESPTHQRRHHRIKFIFRTLRIETFVSRIGILSMHDIVPSGHRTIYFYINLIAYLKDPDLQSSITTYFLSTKTPYSPMIYKKYLENYLKTILLLKSNQSRIKLRMP